MKIRTTEKEKSCCFWSELRRVQSSIKCCSHNLQMWYCRFSDVLIKLGLDIYSSHCTEWKTGEKNFKHQDLTVTPFLLFLLSFIMKGFVHADRNKKRTDSSLSSIYFKRQVLKICLGYGSKNMLMPPSFIWFSLLLLLIINSTLQAWISVILELRFTDENLLDLLGLTPLAHIFQYLRRKPKKKCSVLNFSRPVERE